MFKKISVLALFIAVVFSSCVAQKIPASSELLPFQLNPYGRFLSRTYESLELISSGVHFGFTFEGNECLIYATHSDPKGHNYLQYELDGAYQKRIRVDGNSSEPLKISATNGKHTVWIYKATEAHTGAVIIKKVIAPDIKSIEIPDAPIIEFIGNSITCGAAADPSDVPCGTGDYHDQHNAYMAYGPRVARELKTNFVLSSVSGIGIYRNWNSAGPTMPQVYDRADFQENSKFWNFKTFTPQIVSIALGTNDFSGGDGKKVRLPLDSVQFVRKYYYFIEAVKDKYPMAQIALLSSPMLNENTRETLQKYLTIIKSSVDKRYPDSKPVALFFFEPMQARGCSGHPNVEDHAVLASQLVPFFRGLLKN